MAKPRIIHCEDCGAPRLTRWKNTKYCFICRLIRNLNFLSESPGKCLLCDKPFTKLKRNDDLCGECDETPMFKELLGHCAFCDEDERPLIAPNIAICIRCAKAPANRVKMKKSLLHKQKAIREGTITIPDPEVPKSTSKPMELPDV